MATKRRGRGEGCITQKKDGSWVAVLSMGVVDGKRRRRFYYGPDKQAVQAKLLAAQGRSAEGLELSRETLSAYFERWLRDVVRVELKPKTIECYEDTIRRYLNPYVGGLPLGSIGIAHVQELLSRLKADGYSDRVRQLAHAVLRGSLNKALEWQLVRQNPASVVSAPTPNTAPRKVWTDEQAKLFLTTAQDARLYPLLVLALTTAMREGELLGLQWPDTDLKASTIAVQHNLVEVRNKIVGLFTPKTRAGLRTVTLPPMAVLALKAQRARLFEEGLAAGSYVFPTRGGKPMHKRVLYKAYERILEKSGLPRITFHDLRHTSATLLLAAGESPQVVQNRLGHANIATTLNVYGHVTPGMQRGAADKMEGVLK